MKQPSKDNKQKKRRKTLHSLCSVSALLLSVVCCMALIHVELRIQEHHHPLISNSVTVCDQMELQILRKVQQNYERWQVRKVDNFKDHCQETNGEDKLENNLRFSLLPIYIPRGEGVLSIMAYTGTALPKKGTFFSLQSRGFTR